MISKGRLAEEYAWVHKNTTTMSGRTTVRNKDKIKAVIEKVNPFNILDYGCGKGWQYTRDEVHKEWGVPIPTCYDPYIKEFEKLPGVSAKWFDLVLCVDVMEHILPEEVDDVLHEVMFLGNFVYFHIDTKPALKTFSCGTNFHVSLHSKEEWIEKISKHGDHFHADFE